MGNLLTLLMQIPSILTVIHQIVLIIESAFPNATGAKKLDTAVATVQQIVPAISDAASSPGIVSAVNLVVGLLNAKGGTFANAKANTIAPVDPAIITAMETPAQLAQDAAQEASAPAGMVWAPHLRQYVPIGGVKDTADTFNSNSQYP